MAKTKPYSLSRYRLDRLPFFATMGIDLHCRSVAINALHFKRGQGLSAFHKHRRQEEVYIVLSGSGVIRLNNKTVKLRKGDAVRVAPGVSRAIGNPSSPDCVFLVVGAMPHKVKKGKFEVIPDGIYQDNRRTGYHTPEKVEKAWEEE
jgi:mannose-6-phosphate isomerase-like protein (cupin superfamily)